MSCFSVIVALIIINTYYYYYCYYASALGENSLRHIPLCWDLQLAMEKLA